MATGPQFSFAAVEAALIAAYGVLPTDRPKFRARLTHAQKAGLFGVRPGKGTRLAYGPAEMNKLILICELSELGSSPAIQIELIGALWEKRLQAIFKLAAAAMNDPPGPRDIIMILFGASLMLGGWTGAVPNVNHCRLDQLASRLDLAMRGDHDALMPRALMTNLTAQLRRFHNALADAHLKFEQPPIETDKAPSESVPTSRRRARNPRRVEKRKK